MTTTRIAYRRSALSLSDSDGSWVSTSGRFTPFFDPIIPPFSTTVATLVSVTDSTYPNTNQLSNCDHSPTTTLSPIKPSSMKINEPTDTTFGSAVKST